MAAFLAVLIVAAPAAPTAARADATDDAIQASLAAALSPELLDLLNARFPADLDALRGRIRAAQEGVATQIPAAIPLADMLARIQARDGDLLLRAPDDSLRAIFAAQKALAEGLASAQPALCGAIAGGGRAFRAPDPAIAALADRRTRAILTAIADGRDRGVQARRATEDDYGAFAREARRGGIAVGAWAVLSPTNLQQTPPPQICAAIVSVSDAVLALREDLTARVMTDMSVDMLVRDAATYRAVLR